MTDFAPTGSDNDLEAILHGEYACTRSWDAWQVGTMTQDDFTPMLETEIVGGLLAWRDAAVKNALDAMLPPGIDQRIGEITDLLKMVSRDYFDYGRLHDERAELKRIKREHAEAVKRVLGTSNEPAERDAS